MLPGANHAAKLGPGRRHSGGPEGARPHLRSAAPRRWRPEGGSGRLGHWLARVLAGSGTGWLGYWDGDQGVTYGDGDGTHD